MVSRRLAAACAGAAIALTGSVALPAPSAGATSVAPISGVGVHPWRFESSERAPFWALRDPEVRDRSFAALQDAGVKRARVDLRWNVAEPLLKGVYDWSEFDAIHRSAVAHGIQLLPVIAFTPPWANESAGIWAPPREPSDFGDFVAAALERYPDIDAWEIWNEPNLAFFWRPSPNVGDFVALLRAADEARKRVGSGAKLISGGLSSTGEDPFRWFDDMARLGAFAHVDGFGLHPYSRTAAPDDRKSFFLKVPEFRRRLVALGREEIGLWLTEYGSPNATVASQYGPPITAEQQAENLARAYTLASLWPWVANLSWHELEDACNDAKDPDCRYGLFTADREPKPAFGSLRSAIAGARVRLRSELTQRVAAGKPTGRAGGRARRVTVRGVLTTAGEPGAAGTVRVSAGAGGRVRSVRAKARDGSYTAKLGYLGPGTWRIVARFAGTKVHLPASSPVSTVRVPR